MSVLTADILRRYDKPGPRYTSYPTAVEFHEGVDRERYADHLDRAAHAADEPLSLYVHLPFCEERCLYCGCNVVVTRRREIAEPYLDAVETEIRGVAERLGPRRRLRQMHWGGGTPTYLTPDQLQRLHRAARDVFTFEPGAEVAIELDPRVTTQEHLDTLHELGFNRLSLGVQDFTPEVQESVNRVQSFDETRQLIDNARRLGFAAVNLDLIYGLPHQTLETFVQTLHQVIELAPDRLAVYSYAHMPWLKVQQRRIPEDTLPSADVKIELIASAIEAFTSAGYLAIGMDHFARPDDELGRALSDGTLWRNFMGYTVRHAPDTVACGMSSIGEVDGAFFQNEKKLIRYQNLVRDGGLAVTRGYVLDADDQLRRYVITALMCAFKLDIAEVEKRFGIDFQTVFAAELEALQGFEEDGLVRVADDRIEVVGNGRLLVRNVCMVFDAYLRRGASEQPRFSRTV